MTHPEETLAGYVDGALTTRERAEVDAHLASCAECREGVELARAGRAAVAALPEVPVPLGVTGPVLRNVRKERPWLTRAGRPVAFAAAAALVAAVGWVGLRSLGGAGDQPSQTTADTTAPAAEDGEAETAADGPKEAGATNAFALEEQDVDYDDAAVQALARSIAGGRLYAAGGDDARSAELQVDDPLSEALACLREGAGIGPSDQPVRVIEARFQGTAAYLGAFLTGLGAGQAPDRLSIYVVAKGGCTLLSFAQQRL